MKSNLTTFQGSLGELVHGLRESNLKRSASAVIKYFPETGRNRSISGDSFDSLGEYCNCPDLRKKLLNERRVWFNVPFFDKDVPTLVREVYAPLYSFDKAEVKKAKRALEQFCGELKKIRQYYNRSRREEGESTFANEDIALVVRDLRRSGAKRFENWIIGGCSPDIGKIDDFILRAESWAGMLSGSKKRGRPPDRFSILVFHVVKCFTFRCFRWWRERKDGKYKIQRDYIMRDGKFRVRKNWQLICAALLLIHVREGIPEMKTFIKEHEDEDANTALRSLTAKVKKEYSNLRRTGKGSGKFARAFPSPFLDVLRVYADDNGSFRARLF